VNKIPGFLLACAALLLSCESQWTTRVAGIDPDTRDIGELNTLLVAMDAQAEAIVETVQEKGVLYQRLGIQYLEAQMIGPALDAFTKASYYYPESPGIKYYIGVTAAGMYANATNPNQRERLLAQAERAYRNALTLNTTETRALYALATLLHFEKLEDVEALGLLELLLRNDSDNLRAKFLKARVHYSLGERARAAEIYGDLIGEINPEDEAGQDLIEHAQRLLGEVRSGGSSVDLPGGEVMP
jgi:tetratricopeptide (TPR) repeat protein